MPATEEDYRRIAETNNVPRRRKGVGQKKHKAKLKARAKRVSARIAENIAKNEAAQRAKEEAWAAKGVLAQKLREQRQKQNAELQKRKHEAKEKARRDYMEGKMDVYFVEGAGLIKIGVSKDVEKRIASLKNGSPVPLTLLGYIQGSRALEAELHERFADIRDHGEWFQATDVLRQYIAEADLIDIADV